MCVTSELPGNIQLEGMKKREERNSAFRMAHQEDFGDQYLPGQRRGVTMVSRLQCVQSAVATQIKGLIRQNPRVKVGLITFSNDVTIIGDGSEEPVIVTGDKLHSWDELQKIGSAYTVKKSIKKVKDNLLGKLWDLEEGGATALGPALQLGIGIAGSRPGSSVILCTDGLANIGLGSLEGKETQFTPYYTELAEQAKLKGVSVSVISLIGSECSLENLSNVTEQTGGSVKRVDPIELTGELSCLADLPILGYTTMAMFLLHRGLRFKNEMDDENENRNWVVKDLGNVRADTEITVAYSFRSKEEYDLTNIEQIPFQLQLMYTKPNGVQYLRTATTMLNVTNNRSEAEQNADVTVIGTYAAQRAAKFAKEGDYEKAQMEARSAQRFLVRNGLDENKLSKWNAQVQRVDDAVISEKKKEKSAPMRNRKFRGDAAVEAFSKNKAAKSDDLF